MHAIKDCKGMLFKKVHVSYIIMVVIINLFTDLYKKVYTIRCCTIVRGGILQWTFVKPDLVLPTSILHMNIEFIKPDLIFPISILRMNLRKTWFNTPNFKMNIHNSQFQFCRWTFVRCWRKWSSGRLQLVSSNPTSPPGIRSSVTGSPAWGSSRRTSPSSTNWPTMHWRSAKPYSSFCFYCLVFKLSIQSTCITSTFVYTGN